MSRGLRTFPAAFAIALMALLAAPFGPGPAMAQAPQSKFADVNGVKLH